jgi:hypothetical protein
MAVLYLSAIVCGSNLELQTFARLEDAICDLKMPWRFEIPIWNVKGRQKLADSKVTSCDLRKALPDPVACR